MSHPHLQLDHVRLGYRMPDGMHVVVDDLSLVLHEGRIGCLLGPSGCGKSTVLRAISGFEPLMAGSIALHGQVVATSRRSLAPEKRRVGVMFQDYALFPHLSVADNVGFGLRREQAAVRARRVAELLSLVGLAALAGKYPHELSGGQQQRVALARALAPRPELLLLDEPFSSLDVDLRERLADEVRGILKEAEATAILVTHDQAEAFAMADEIGVMAHGRIVQWDSAYNLYHYPATPFVAGFIGAGVLVPGRRLGNGERIRLEFGEADAAGPPPDTGSDGAVSVLLRPDDVCPDADSPVKARLVHKAFRGPDYLYTLRLPSGNEVLAYMPREDGHRVGDHLGIRLRGSRLVAFPAASPADPQ
ncbi:ABC transporter ATP-binding protein [Pigmentiphaga sp. NML080357]|uniref:ABC transporter ATP-binding protein n=1 Tax=Pigmentiphaga sp. NML080357 TaxID=2008675 RepID=UPI000B417342|nr:ABC transporter ATP-binding protein [Pigmentiphaga sp. NML080357]OVZ59986.1 ABC transporter ATP-binding protein [Pigmentiphaga sp. NML080357]